MSEPHFSSSAGSVEGLIYSLEKGLLTNADKQEIAKLLRAPAQPAMGLEDVADIIRDKVYADENDKVGGVYDAAQKVIEYVTAPAAQPPGAFGYAQRLATTIWEKHWKDDAPEWRPLPDIVGVLTQIDNMVAGLSREAVQVTDEMVTAGAIGLMQDVQDYDGGPSFYDASEQSRAEAKAMARACLNAALAMSWEVTETPSSSAAAGREKPSPDVKNVLQPPAAPVETLDFEAALRQALDDLTVEDGKCNWAEVANILPRMRGELRAYTPQRLSAETAIAALAKRFWSIHPKEIQDLGITREQFYEREMRALFAALVPNEPQGVSQSSAASGVHYTDYEGKVVPVEQGRVMHGTVNEPQAVQVTPRWDANDNRRYEPVETLAKEIYDALPYDGAGKKPAWVPNGNSWKQDDARFAARWRLWEAGHTPAVGGSGQ